jgi:hypothetical protein
MLPLPLPFALYCRPLAGVIHTFRLRHPPTTRHARRVDVARSQMVGRVCIPNSSEMLGRPTERALGDLLSRVIPRRSPSGIPRSALARICVSADRGRQVSGSSPGGVYGYWRAAAEKHCRSSTYVRSASERLRMTPGGPLRGNLSGSRHQDRTTAMRSLRRHSPARERSTATAGTGPSARRGLAPAD